MLRQTRISDDEALISTLEKPSAYTSVQTLEKHAKNCHLLPLFGVPGVSPRWQVPLDKSMRHREIGLDARSAWPAQNRVA
jgi:hypothetical protein